MLGKRKARVLSGAITVEIIISFTIARSLEKAEELEERIVLCPPPIWASDQDNVDEGVVVGQQNFDHVLDTKSQNKEKQWAKNQGIGLIKSRPHTFGLIGQ